MRASGRAAELAVGLTSGSRGHLSRAITMAESTRSVDRAATASLLRELPRPKHPAFRIGISGPPGAGKSTFIEATGTLLLKKRHRVAVLAVDPSSVRTGGSILGDKTRMPELARSDNAYVRPSPTRGTLGGVTRRTTEAILLCEAAGYNPVLVETVGVGQSETAVEDMVDAFVLLVSPAGGDELQGIKKGVVELADIIVVNKADGPLVEVAKRTQTDYARAVQLFRAKTEHWVSPVLTCSAHTGDGIEGIWQSLSEFRDVAERTGEWERRREAQRKSWLWKMLNEELSEHFMKHPRVRPLLPRMEADVACGVLTPGTAADWLLAEFEGSISKQLPGYMAAKTSLGPH